MKIASNLKPLLNLDVLLMVMSFSEDIHTISRLMRASRELYTQGPKYLLRDAVYLENASHILSFVAFMLADHPHRLPLLDSLYIHIGLFSAADADVLEKFLIACGPLLGVKRLVIKHAEEFFKSSPGLASAFGLLRHVQHLVVSEVGQHTSVFLRDLQSSLVSADLEMIPHNDGASSDDNDEGDDDEGDEEEVDEDERLRKALTENHRNPILLLHNSQETLKTLDARSCGTTPDFTRSDQYEECYPTIQKLTLTANELPNTLYYARAFPNVHTLTLRIDPSQLEILGDDLEDFDNFRESNMFDFTEYEGPKWTALKAVHGALTDHFLLGLSCPVEQLHIDGPYMNTMMFHAVLATTRPKYVYFHAFDVEMFENGEFDELMSGPLLGPVRCFDIMVAFGGVILPEQVDVPASLDALIEGISNIPSLRSFGLSLGCFGLQPDGELLKDVANPAPLCPAEEYILALDLDALARRIRAAVPGLQTVTVSLIGHRARRNDLAVSGDYDAYEVNAVETLPLMHAMRIVAYTLTKNSTLALLAS
ncbi:uncharacterized protein TRAVEDRAFT_27712 [Trametes versicolor FP-101664 SS1]|uniref:uncharacterized protein n=1 Tax=Trametes versicolor (strain FP-101664) TaxID=717944 RepID=UPI0004624686|nr:uncharacterized protein TRAVEDRAFT_27712 [Trametes versicolor FP-101664 SS1]EIW62398.1 hypothetical protein TRAVEDRAFT_27712 [Trametes versicolor FP-101664 SS1]